MINSSQKGSFCLRSPLSRLSRTRAIGRIECLFSSLLHLLLLLLLLLLLCSPSSSMRRPLCQLAGCSSSSKLRDCCCALSMLSRAWRLQGFSTSWCWSLCSHELWLLHRLLVRGWIPWGVAGNVRSGCAHWSLHGGRRAPDRCHRGGAARKSAASGQSVGVNCATALLHEFLEFGPLILKPNFYLCLGETQRRSELRSLR